MTSTTLKSVFIKDWQFMYLQRSGLSDFLHRNDSKTNKQTNKPPNEFISGGLEPSHRTILVSSENIFVLISFNIDPYIPSVKATLQNPFAMLCHSKTYKQKLVQKIMVWKIWITYCMIVYIFNPYFPSYTSQKKK